MGDDLLYLDSKLLEQARKNIATEPAAGYG
jgi:hypothetical protein